MAVDLRPYCPSKYLTQYDEYTAAIAPAASNVLFDADDMLRCKECEGHSDPHARLRDMDHDGIAATTIFAGGQNDEHVPFSGALFGYGSASVDAELRAVGSDIWNRWLADYVQADLARLRGMIQIPIWDVDRSIEILRWASERDLRCVNFPAPRDDYPAYNDPIYEPFWSVCEELGMTLNTHGGGGMPPAGAAGPGGLHLILAENHWFSRRSLWQLIFGGVFERHPRLRLIFTEQRVKWVGNTLDELDNIYYYDSKATRPAQSPRDYWHANCLIAGSFLAPFEVELREEVGLHNLMWGDDYPHAEGTWPDTAWAIRNTFHRVPENEARLILGETAVDVYQLDRERLRAVADRIGPTPGDALRPPRADERPVHHGLAERVSGSYS